jgi:hypothetical protein
MRTGTAGERTSRTPGSCRANHRLGFATCPQARTASWPWAPIGSIPIATGTCPFALDVLTLRGTRIAGIIAYRGPEVLRPFGLPDELPA